jgi:hypothetical protein
MSLTTVHVESNVAARSARDALSPVRLWLALAKINQPEFDLSRPPRLSFDVRWPQMEDSPVKTSPRQSGKRGFWPPTLAGTSQKFYRQIPAIYLKITRRARGLGFSIDPTTHYFRVKP